MGRLRNLLRSKRSWSGCLNRHVIIQCMLDIHFGSAPGTIPGSVEPLQMRPQNVIETETLHSYSTIISGRSNSEPDSPP